MKYFALAFGWMVTVFPYASIYGQTWIKTYGGGNWDFGHSVCQTSDGGYIIAGRTMSFGAGGEDLYLIRTDSAGDTIWTKTYGGSGSDGATSIALTSDGGYIIAGRTQSFGAGYLDVWLLKTDSSGDTLWTKTYGGLYEDWGNCVEPTLDGGYIIAGYKIYATGVGDMWLIKTDGAGNLVWDRTYGGSNHDEASSVKQTADGGYIAVGTYDYNIADAQVYLIKTNSLGDTIWTKKYGGSETDYGMDVIENANGEYVVVGKSTRGALAGEAYVFAVDASGELLWEKTYGGSMDDWAHSIMQTTDGGYILGGSDVQPPSGYNALWLLKIDAMGDTIWTKRFTENSYAYTVRQTQDNGFIAAGSIYSSGTGYDVYVVKTDPNGNVGIKENRCVSGNMENGRLRIIPNPFRSYAAIAGRERTRVLVYDIQGRCVGTYSGNRIGEALCPGVYFAKLENTDATARVVKIR
ncbi:MAG TPA: hypothetical protein VF399_07585 [bacterium]